MGARDGEPKKNSEEPRQKKSKNNINEMKENMNSK
jgi:hypothetical protein